MLLSVTSVDTGCSVKIDQVCEVSYRNCIVNGLCLVVFYRFAGIKIACRTFLVHVFGYFQLVIFF